MSVLRWLFRIQKRVACQSKQDLLSWVLKEEVSKHLGVMVEIRWGLSSVMEQNLHAGLLPNLFVGTVFEVGTVFVGLLDERVVLRHEQLLGGSKMFLIEQLCEGSCLNWYRHPWFLIDLLYGD